MLQRRTYRGMALDAVSGNLGYFGRLAAEKTAGITPINYSYSPLDVRRYQAITAVTSDQAIASAIAACGSTGGIVRLPRGTYTFNNQIVLTNKVNITLEGDGGRVASASSATTVLYTGTGSSPFITAGGSTGCQVLGMYIQPTSSAYSGDLIKLGTAPGVANGFRLSECSLGTLANTACGHINVDASEEICIEHCNFTGGSTQIKGQAASSFSNVVTIYDCQFIASTSDPISGCGESWTIFGNAFEGVKSGATTIAGAIGLTSATAAKNLVFLCNWLGDVSTGSVGTWITFFGTGFTCLGNRFGGSSAATGISVNAASAVEIKGNTFNGFSVAVSFDTATNVDAIVQGNYFVTVTTQIGGAHLPQQLVFNPNSPLVSPPTGYGSTAANGYRIDPFTQIIEQWGTAAVTTGTPLAVTFNTNGINFPTACWNIQVSLEAPSGTGNTVSYTGKSTTGFTINVAGAAGSNTVDWRAEGN